MSSVAFFIFTLPAFLVNKTKANFETTRTIGRMDLVDIQATSSRSVIDSIHTSSKTYFQRS